MIKFFVTQNGVELDRSKYCWDEKTRVFSTNESNLVLDFSNINNVTFKTSSNCVFKTGFNCIFDTGFNCTFDTGSHCTFKNGSCCAFDTGSHCTFDTGSNCTFKTGEKCVIIRRDIYEVIEIPENTKIKLNDHQVKGYEIINEIKRETVKVGGSIPSSPTKILCQQKNLTFKRRDKYMNPRQERKLKKQILEILENIRCARVDEVQLEDYANNIVNMFSEFNHGQEEKSNITFCTLEYPADCKNKTKVNINDNWENVCQLELTSCRYQNNTHYI